jgi:hypothetical protein
MFSNWFEQYKSLMQRTRFLSQLGAFWMFVFAFLELWNTWIAISKGDYIADDTWSEIFRIGVIHASIGIAFALRFFHLLFYRPNTSSLPKRCGG